MKDPFFIIGTERSGSNLLRMILNESPELCVPHPPHFLKNLTSLATCYGNLESDANFENLVRDCLTYLKLHPYPWELLVSVKEVCQRAPLRSLLGIHCALYDLYSEREGKARWGCKSTFSVRHLAEISTELPTARFIHLVRDPRDVCVSAMKSQFNHFHPYFIARLWNEEQGLVSYAQDILGARLYTLRYEDLIENPECEVQAICRFLDVTYTPRMLEYYLGAEARKSMSLSQAWANTGVAIIKDNKEKYKSILSDEEILIVEASCLFEMEKYKYTFARSKVVLERKRLQLFKHVPTSYYCLEWLRMFSKQLALLSSDEYNARRILKYWFVRWLRFKLWWRRA